MIYGAAMWWKYDRINQTDRIAIGHEINAD